ncbi:MAG: MmgE/PrpD family protein [Caldilineaceae bacterium]
MNHASTLSTVTPLTRRLAETLANTTYALLPSSVIVDAQRSVLDWLGSALAGSLEAPARMAQTVVATLGRAEDATVFSAGRSSAAGAALANGVASHILELDDVHKGSTLHGAAPIIPAALAVAEREQATGQAFLLAVVLGYEAALRIGEAVNPSHYRFWHPTGTAATFGAAAAAGSLLRLTPEQMLHALGSAGTQAAGLWEFNADGAMSKHLHPGKAAMNGVLAADLAKVGFTGASRILEGERGFFQAMSQEYDPTRITDGLGERWKISENCYKLYACCGHTHTAIDTALDLRAQLGWQDDEALTQVQMLTIETYGPGYAIVKEMNPRTPYQAKFSLAYVAAAALLEGWVGLEQFTPERFTATGVAAPKLAALLPRIQVRVREELTAMYPAAWPARLSLTLADGTVLHAGSDYPRGNPENPVTTATLAAKFRALVAPRLSEDAAQQWLHFVQTLKEAGPLSPHLVD